MNPTDRLNPTDQLVLSALHQFTNNQGTVTESTRTLAAHIGRSAPTVATSLKRLVANGQIMALPKTSTRSIGRYEIVEESSVKNRGKTLLNKCPLLLGSEGLPDVFRSPALRTAGVLHRAAPKGQLLTIPELLGLGVIRTAKTMRKVLGQLEDLRSPLAKSLPDPAHSQRVLWVINPLTTEAETLNIAYLNLLPGAEPKTRAQQEAEHAEQQQNYVRWFGGHRDVATAYAQDVEPFLIPDTHNPGCMVWAKELSEDGYARPYPDKPYLTAHRMAWHAEVGYLATGQALHHACGNRACASVYHLMPVTPEQHRAIHQAAV